MTSLGANFAWTQAVSGSLVPMTVLGDLATTPNAVPELDYFNDGYAGAGSDVEPLLEFNGQHFGFYYEGGGTSAHACVLTTSDEDWVWNNSSPQLMENILHKLAGCTAQSVRPLTMEVAVMVPGLFTNELELRTEGDGAYQFDLFDASGRLTVHKAFTGPAILNTGALGSGVYIYELRDASGRCRKGRTVKE